MCVNLIFIFYKNASATAKLEHVSFPPKIYSNYAIHIILGEMSKIKINIALLNSSKEQYESEFWCSLEENIMRNIKIHSNHVL